MATSDGSIAIVEVPPFSVMITPVPLKRFLDDKRARKSVPPAASKEPFVTFQVKSGIELDGNEVIPAAYIHFWHVKAAVLPALRFPAPSIKEAQDRWSNRLA